MAGIFPNPLSNDGVDRLNHKWMLLLILLLSLAAFIIPLHPTFHEQPHQTGSETLQPSPRTQAKQSTPDLSCWCPVEFTQTYVNYVHAFCRAGFISLLNGHDTNVIFKSIMDEVLPINKSSLKFNIGSLQQSTGNIQQKKKEKPETESESERRTLRTQLQPLVTYQTSLMLLWIAAILAVPQVLWSFLSDCCSPFNLAQTLASASQARHMDAANRNQLYEDLSASLTSCFHNCPKTASVLYLVKKVLSILLVIALLLLVTQHALPKIQDMVERSDSLTPSSNIKVPFNNDASTIYPISQSPQDTFKPPNNVVLCEFQIRQLQSLQTWNVQCVVTFSDYSHLLPQALQPTVLSNHDKNLLALDATLFKMTTAVLAILAVANVLSFCGWLYSLTSTSSKNSVRLSGNAAMDLALLVHMARINCGADVAHRLACCSSGLNKVDLSEMTEAT